MMFKVQDGQLLWGLIQRMDRVREQVAGCTENNVMYSLSHSIDIETYL